MIDPEVDSLAVPVPDALSLYLKDLLVTGLFGASIEEVAGRLVERGIQEMIQSGLISRRETGY